jgi:hypothetical protein
MEYLHYTDKPLQLRDIILKEKMYKPNGLWLSQGNEWEEWCQDAGIQTCDMDNCYVYKIEFKKDSLYRISSVDELQCFSERYNKNNNNDPHFLIPWKKVSEEYDGICFENYRDVKQNMFRDKLLRNANLWFLAVDVNSACIWNPTKVVTSITLVEKRECKNPNSDE